ncbi:hypothetical protein [Mycobacterium intracellulare]|uniref:hypothetical protein n=1 Tax=Mycobacterium intracellulare TaxID=1767 RepID=UPI0039B52CAF
MKDFNAALCDFYAHPGYRRGNRSNDQLGRQALDCVLSCETRLLIIDDLHFLHWQRSGGVEISNHFKYVSNEFPVTLLFIGIGLGDRGVLMEDLCCSLEGAGYGDIVLEQTARRTTMLEMRPYGLQNDKERCQWNALLATVEQRLVLGPNIRACWWKICQSISMNEAPVTSDRSWSSSGADVPARFEPALKH